MHNNSANNRRQQNNNGNVGPANNAAAEESRMALVLFFIVILYLVTNTPRLALNFYEFFRIDNIRSANKFNNCFIHPTWILSMTPVSLVLITFNSSINFFIYCMFNSTFRNEFLNHWKSRRLSIFPSSCCCVKSDESYNSQNPAESVPMVRVRNKESRCSWRHG